MPYFAIMKGLQYSSISSDSQQVLALTGLLPEEFEDLCNSFSKVWQTYVQYYTLEGKPRKRIVGKVRSNSQLPTDHDKLLFILYYLKTNPLQQDLAVSFGMKQPHAHTWLNLLRPRLEECLSSINKLPVRKSSLLNKQLGNLSRVLIDGTERPIQRSGDYETQKEYFSGKKKDTA